MLATLFSQHLPLATLQCVYQGCTNIGYKQYYEIVDFDTLKSNLDLCANLHLPNNAYLLQVFLSKVYSFSIIFIYLNVAATQS